MAAECSICEEETEFQKFLNCGSTDEQHKFCQICILKLAKIDSNGDPFIECPICRKSTLLPNGDAGKLKTKFFAELICENCLEPKIIKDQWWCKDCDVAVCSACAMNRHRLHVCNPFEQYDVPVVIMSVLKTEQEEKERDRGEFKSKIQHFCETLESKLLEKFSTNDDVDGDKLYFVNNLEKCFGNLPPLDKLKRENVRNFDKKLKIVVELMKSTKTFPDVDCDELNEKLKNDKGGGIVIKFPSMNEVIELFENCQKPPASTKTVITPTLEANYASACRISEEISRKSFNSNSNLNRSKLNHKCVPRFSWMNCMFTSKVNFAVRNENELCCTDGRHLVYFIKKKNAKVFSVGKSLRIADENVNMAPSQICYHERRDSFFTLQMDAGNIFGFLKEYSSWNSNSGGLNEIGSSSLPLPTVKMNSTHLITILYNGDLIMTISDEMKFFVHLLNVNELRWEKLFENERDCFMLPNVPLEKLSHLQSHFIEENKDMIVLSGKKSAYCLILAMKKIEGFKIFTEVMSSKFSYFSFANDTNIFVVDLCRKVLRKIDMETHAEQEEATEQFHGLRLKDDSILSSSADQNFFYILKQNTFGGQFFNDFLVIFKIC